MSKLLSPSEKANCQVSPDNVMIIFKSMVSGEVVIWPVSDWEGLKRFIDEQIKEKAETN